MKVLLMVPLTSLMSQHPNIPDVGLGYLASALRKDGHSVHIQDWNCKLRIEEFIDYLRETKPDVTGIKVFTINIPAVLKTISIIKSVDQSIVVVLGGPHISASPPQETMEEFGEASFAVQGEGERSFPLLLKEISKKGDSRELSMGDIPGLIWRENSAVRNNTRLLTEDLDNLDLPSWDLINPKHYDSSRIDIKNKDGDVAPLITTRGCPARCTFCAAHHVNGRKIRARSAQNIIEEIELLYHKFNVRQLMIMDTNFTYNRDIVEDVCNMLIEKKLELSWDCLGDPGRRTWDMNILSCMSKAGCKIVNLGIESGSNRIRRLIGKEPTVEEVREKISLIRRAGIRIRGFFMLGFPEETLEDMKRTIEFAFSLRLDSLAFEVCYPLPGTEMYSELTRKFNIERIEWDSFNVYNSPYPVSEVSSKKATQLVKSSRRRALFRPFDLHKIYGKISKRFFQV